MIIKCDLCRKEFDTKNRLRQHKRDAHPEGAVQYLLKEAAKAAAPQSTAQTAQEE